MRRLPRFWRSAGTKGWSDEAHPDTALAGLLSRYILGAYPTSPGWATYEVKPVAPKSVTFAEGDIPTPRGILHVSWKRGDDGAIALTQGKTKHEK